MLPTSSTAIRRLFDTVAAMPWSALKSVEETLLWSVPPEPKGPKWADDVFTPCKAMSMPLLLEAPSHDEGDELTDSCSSTYSSDEEVAEWSSDDGLDESWMDDGDEYAYAGERWYWSPPPSSTRSDASWQEEKYETASQRSADLDELELEHADEHYRRPTMYAMPSMDFGAVDSWVDRYGSSRSDVAYVATLKCELSEAFQPLPPSTNGFYIPKL